MIDAASRDLQDASNVVGWCLDKGSVSELYLEETCGNGVGVERGNWEDQFGRCTRRLLQQLVQ